MGKSILWTTGPIALAYLAMVVVAMFTESSGKMAMMRVLGLFIPSVLLTVIIGLFVFLPKIVAGPDRMERVGLWVAHALLCTCLSFVLLVFGTFMAFGFA